VAAAIKDRMRFIAIPPRHSLRYKRLAAALVAVNYEALAGLRGLIEG
jgi:hypothetical protein